MSSTETALLPSSERRHPGRYRSFSVRGQDHTWGDHDFAGYGQSLDLVLDTIEAEYQSFWAQWQAGKVACGPTTFEAFATYFGDCSIWENGRCLAVVVPKTDGIQVHRLD